MPILFRVAPALITTGTALMALTACGPDNSSASTDAPAYTGFAGATAPTTGQAGASTPAGAGTAGDSGLGTGQVGQVPGAQPPGAGGATPTAANPDGTGSPATDAQAGDPAIAEDPYLVDYDGPASLAEAGLYEPGTQTVAADVLPFEPQYPLWSDGAKKQRWLWLPPGSQINSDDMDQWVFPVGTRVFKEFRATDPNTGAEVRVETRLLEKRASDWLAVAFIWNPEQTEAKPAPGGRMNVLDTAHDVPSKDDCMACHMGGSDLPLGLDAIQLSSEDVTSGLTLAELRSRDLLTTDPGTDAFTLPGDATAQAALGMLHVNCGSCHQPGTFAFERTDLDLRLTIASLSDETTTPAYQTSVGVPNQKRFDEWPLRIDPGQSATSAMVGRTLSRESMVAMPPIGSEIPDSEGAKVLSAWIDSLPASAAP